MVSPRVKVTTGVGCQASSKKLLVQKLPNEIAAKKTLKNPGRWTREVVFCFFTRSPCGMARPVELGGGAPRDGPGVHARGMGRRRTIFSRRARTSCLSCCTSRRRPRRRQASPRAGAARSDRRVASPVRPAARPGGAERAGGHAEPARGHALVHEPEELPGGVQRRAAAGSCVPRGATPPATAGRAGVGFATSAGSGRARRRGRGGRRGGPGRGRGERPTGPAHGGRTHGRATSAAPDARPSVPSARGVPRRGMPLLRP